MGEDLQEADTVTLYRKALDYLVTRIEDNTWKPGEQIPTEMELAATLGISRPTVRQALQRLTDQGYLVRIKGKGTFVSQPKFLYRSAFMLSSYRQESEARGLRILTEILCHEERRVHESITEQLQITPGKKAGVLTRLRRVDRYHENRPMVLSTLYVSTKNLPDFMAHDFTDNSFYRYLEEKKLSVRKASRILEVIMPTAEDAKLLEMSPFEPVIRINSLGFAAGGTPVEYTENLYPAGRNSFLIEIGENGCK